MSAILMCRRKSPVFLFLLVLLLCSNCLLVAGQRSKLSTSIRPEKPRWVPRNIITPSPPPTEASANTTSTISDQSDEKDVSPTKSLEIAVTTTTSAEEAAASTPNDSSSATTEQPKNDGQPGERVEEQEKAVTGNEKAPVEVAAPEKEVKQGPVRAEKLRDASKDEKVAVKRDLPFLIQTSPGIQLYTKLFRVVFRSRSVHFRLTL